MFSCLKLNFFFILNGYIAVKKGREELIKKMKRIKEELDQEQEEGVDDEGEESEEEDELEESKGLTKFDEFEILKAKVRAKMPKKIAAKGIISTFGPIEEESIEEQSFSDLKIKSEIKTEEEPPQNYEEFKSLTDEEKRKHIQNMMKNPTFNGVINEQQDNTEESDQNQNEEIQRRLGKIFTLINKANIIGMMTPEDEAALEEEVNPSKDSTNVESTDQDN